MPRPPSDIRHRLIEAARARFLVLGVDGASLREIARDAGTNIGMVVYYFPTKDELFLAVVEDVYGKIVDDVEHILKSGGLAKERLRRIFIRLGTASDVELEVLRLIIREVLGSSARLRQVLARFMRGHIPLLLGTLQEGVRRGELDDKIPLPLLLLLVFGIGALPQVIRRASRSVPLLSSLPDAETLATLSADLLSAIAGPPSKRDRSSHRAKRLRAKRRAS